mmetsp:Transcript_10184/g.14406  ORF Transcript_10184/g.14406 Transcript_10184/m.14406 type:complete len:288 (+) Transcript_10184:150-1013(+)
MDSIVNMILFKPPESFPYAFDEEVIRLKTDRGNRIGALHIQRPGATLTVLFSHGNAEDLTTSYGWIKKLSRALNVNVISYDYAGYGESTGTPHEKNCYADIDAVYRYLVNNQNVAPEKIVLYGRSLGSGPSCYLGAKTSEAGRPVAGVILHSPFTSVYRVVVDFGFSGWGDKFCNIDRVRKFRCPAFIVHGRDDTVVPFEHGPALYDAIPKNYRANPFWVSNMGHNSPGFHIELVLFDRMKHFLNDCVTAKKERKLEDLTATAREEKMDFSNILDPCQVCAVVDGSR